MKLTKWISMIAVASFCAQATLAQDVKGIVPNSENMKKTEGADGWSKSLKFSATGALNSNTNVIGQAEGESYLLGAKLDGDLNWRMGKKEWRNKLIVDQQTSKVPNFDHFVKAQDVLKIESIYLTTLEKFPKLGPFVKFSGETSIFKNEVAKSETTTFTDGLALNTSGDSFRLTDGFNPVTLKESLGVFYKAISKKHMTLEFRAGFGAMQVFASGYNVESDDEDTNTVTVSALDDFTQAGLVLGGTWKGQIDAKTGYDVGFETLTPFIKDLDAGDDRNDFELTNYDAYAKIDTKLYDWLALGYKFNIRKQPQLLDEDQIAHGFNVSLTYILF